MYKAPEVNWLKSDRSLSVRSKPLRLDNRGGMEMTSFFAMTSFLPAGVWTETLTSVPERSVLRTVLFRRTSSSRNVSDTI